MPVRQLVPVYIPNTAIKSRLVALLDARRSQHVRAARDLTRKLGERIDAEAAAKECQAIRQAVQYLRDE